MTNNRLIGLDFIRSSAIISVLSVHFFLNTQFYNTPIIGGNMYGQVFLRSIFMICVPLFMILTGYLHKNSKLEKGYFKKIIPILYIYIIYSVISAILKILVLKQPFSIIKLIFSIENFSADNYSWYINFYIGLFFIIPFLNILYDNLKDKKEKVILIIIGVILTGCPLFFNAITDGYIYISDCWYTLYPLTYYFIGRYINEYQPKVNTRSAILLFFLSVLFESLKEIFLANGQVFMLDTRHFGSLSIMAESVIFFLLLYNIELKKKYLIKIISLISAVSLDIYLISYMTDSLVYKVFNKYFAVTQQKVIIFFVPLVFSTFILSFLISIIRRRLIKIR